MIKITNEDNMDTSTLKQKTDKLIERTQVLSAKIIKEQVLLRIVYILVVLLGISFALNITLLILKLLNLF